MNEVKLLKNLELTVESMKDLMSHFTKNKMSTFALQDGDFSLRFETTGGEAVTVYTSSPASKTEHCVLPAEAPLGNVIKSPIVGTYYSSASPDKPPFIKPGQPVKKGDVLFIIESMKLMNEIQCECNGVIGEIYVVDTQTVEYGQPILTIV